MIRKATVADAAAIASIYNYYILETVITFEVEAISEADMALRIEQISAKYPYLVYEEEGKVVGYAYVGEFRGRFSYRFTGESTIYLNPRSSGKGVGFALYGQLMKEARKQKLHAIMAGITLPNAASQRLHEKLGFEKVGHFREVGYKFDRWLDVGYWEYLF